MLNKYLSAYSLIKYMADSKMESENQPKVLGLGEWKYLCQNQRSNEEEDS